MTFSEGQKVRCINVEGTMGSSKLEKGGIYTIVKCYSNPRLGDVVDVRDIDGCLRSLYWTTRFEAVTMCPCGMDNCYLDDQIKPVTPIYYPGLAMNTDVNDSYNYYKVDPSVFQMMDYKITPDVNYIYKKLNGNCDDNDEDDPEPEYINQLAVDLAKLK